jgi:hypothetical protein
VSQFENLFINCYLRQSANVNGGLLKEQCAMHYAHAVIFSYTEVGVTYRNLEEYFNKHKRIGDTKHSVTLDLIQKLHYPISEKYKQLKDTAHTARYHDYELPNPVVSKIRKNLKYIEDYCEEKYKLKTQPKPEEKIPRISN